MAERREPSQKFRVNGGTQTTNITLPAGGEQRETTRKIPIRTPMSSARWVGTMIGTALLSLGVGGLGGRLLAGPDSTAIAEEATFKQSVRDQLDALKKENDRFDAALKQLEAWLHPANVSTGASPTHRPH